MGRGGAEGGAADGYRVILRGLAREGATLPGQAARSPWRRSEPAEEDQRCGRRSTVTGAPTRVAWSSRAPVMLRAQVPFSIMMR